MTKFYILLCSIFLLAGCGPSGAPRHDISGTVTFNGQPLPFGRVTFEPNGEVGNTGPTGFATIVAGKFATGDTGKGATPGKVFVRVDGYSDDPTGKSDGALERIRLFPTHSQPAEILDDTTLEIVVPAKGEPAA